MDLRHYLFEKRIRTTVFARTLGVHSNTLYGIMCRNTACSIKLAEKIEEYTKGEVTKFEVPMTERSRKILLASVSKAKKMKM